MCSRVSTPALLPVLALLCSALAQSASPPGNWRERLTRPDPAFTQIPFWFWNDDLNDDEIKRQMAAFREHGVCGFIIHARMGLPTSIPYMGERWLKHVRAAADEAARTGMLVYLYDEGMYPSGSAHGQVVRSNPAFAAQGLAVVHKDVAGPAEISVPLSHAGRLVATVAAQRVNGKDSLDLTRGIVALPDASCISVPAGNWRVMTFTAVPTGGRIRGVHPGEDDHQAGAPFAADLLSFDAMKAFIRFAYEPYYETLKDHFGKAVAAVFTDEPSLFGRGGRGGLKPWTDGLADNLARRRGQCLESLLPALFFDAGPKTARIREDFDLTVAQRLDEAYYQQISQWCADHHIALTGHPAGSDEIRPLRHFQIPAQDMVWRWVLPDSPSALEGVNSTVAKCSSSVARHDRRRRNGDELYGAYGWQLTMEEVKWLADWMMVRGVNLLYPHAFYYSLRGDRAQERPPDLGMHNTWWPYYRTFADYTTRVCALLAGGRHVCDVAVLSVNNHLPWRAAKWLFQNQIDFNYLEDWRLIEQAGISDGTITLADTAYRILIVDRDEPLGGPIAERLKAFEAAGGIVRYCRSAPSPELVRGLPPDVLALPPAPDLRYVHVARDGTDFYLLTNEGPAAIETTVTCRCVGRPEWFDPWAARFSPATVVARSASTLSVPLRLERRGSIVLCIEPGEPPAAVPASRKPGAPVAAIPLDGAWRVFKPSSEQVGERLGNWLDSASTTGFTGSLRYVTTFDLPDPVNGGLRLDLGRVGDWAVIRLNGKDLGPRFWAPYEWDVTAAARAGKNELSVEVTNSLANKYDPKQRRPSGLFGPVVLTRQ